MTHTKVLNVLCWSGVSLVGAAFLAYGYISSAYHQAHAIRADGCLAYLSPPAILVVASDETDRLENDQPRRWRTSVVEQITAMPPGTKLLLTEIGDTVPAEVNFESALCVPPPGTSSRLRKMRAGMAGALGRVERELEAAGALKHSPIRRTILAIAADPAFSGAPHREIVVESDLLESDGRVSAYRHRFALPSAPAHALAGITIHFSVLRNLRDAKYQTPELVHAWIAWAQAAGAHVAVDAAWLGFAPSSPQRAA
jgi:hypothetical protein